jgi:hypothetical protein
MSKKERFSSLEIEAWDAFEKAKASAWETYQKRLVKIRKKEAKSNV